MSITPEYLEMQRHIIFPDMTALSEQYPITPWYLAQQRRHRRRVLEARINEHLDGLHSSLFGRAFDLRESRAEAVAFVADLVERFR